MKGRVGHKLNSHKAKQIHDNYKMYTIINYFKGTTIIILEMCYRIIPQIQRKSEECCGIYVILELCVGIKG